MLDENLVFRAHMYSLFSDYQSPPAVGTADAEIKVPSIVKPGL